MEINTMIAIILAANVTSAIALIVIAYTLINDKRTLQELDTYRELAELNDTLNIIEQELKEKTPEYFERKPLTQADYERWKTEREKEEP